MKRKRLYPSLLIILVIGLVAMYVNCSYVPVFNGIDISHHNRVDWKKIKADKDIKFCYIKATEGKSFRDPMCRKHAKRAPHLVALPKSLSLHSQHHHQSNRHY